jgi:DNA polymerase-3 subunit alpha
MAWLKYHYPVEFMAATLSTEFRGNGKDKEQKVMDAIQECKRMEIRILQPNINESENDFTVTPDGKIRFGLGAIKGVGKAATAEIIKKQPYASLEDFLNKVEKKKCNKTVVAKLIIAGAFDFENTDRLYMLSCMCSMRKEDPITEIFIDKNLTLKMPKQYTLKAKLDFEKVLLGGYISGHPLDELGLPSWKNYNSGEKLVTAGIVTKVSKTTVKKGNQSGREMAFAWIETTDGELKIVMFPDCWEKVSDKVVKNKVIKVTGKLDKDNQMIANEVTNPRIKSMVDKVDEQPVAV